MKKESKEIKDTDNPDVITGEASEAGGVCPDEGDGASVNVADGNDIESCGTDDAAAEAAVWKDKYLRLSAEYDNYRKRTLREKLELVNTGGEDVVRSILEVLDDMDRALAAIEGSNELETLKHGLVLINNKLHSALESKGLSEIEAIGSELDTDLHEAIARIGAEDEDMKGRIVDVIQKGYKLKDKIIRHAKVVVCQ